MVDSELSEKDEDAQRDVLCSPVLHTDDESNIYCTGCGVKLWLVRDEEAD
jgi:hypothetical protein